MHDASILKTYLFLFSRIQDSQSKSVADGESLLLDAVTLYHRIKQQEWSEVYEIMTHLTKDSETVICARLISILKVRKFSPDKNLKEFNPKIKTYHETCRTDQNCIIL